MKKLFGLLAVIAISATLFGSIALAQETEQTGDSGLSLGTPADEQVGSTYTKEVFGDWQMRCMRTEDGKDPCNLYQLLNDQNGNSVAEIILYGLPEGQQAVAAATIITPLETLLTAQVRLSIDENPGKIYPFSYCNPQGCVARVGLVDEDLVALRKGAMAKMVIVPVANPNATVQLSMPLTGFTAGLEAVIASNKENGL